MMKTNLPIFWVVLTITISLLNGYGYSQRRSSGFVVMNNRDTVRCTFTTVTKARPELNDYHLIEIVTDKDEIKQFRPKDLQAYVKNKFTFRSMIFPNQDSMVSFFLKEVAQGSRVELGLYAGGILEKTAVYFFRKAGESTFKYFSQERQVKMQSFYQDPSAQRYLGGIMYMSRDEEFRNFFVGYFSSCPLLARKISTEFYTRDDVEAIFKEYNRCK